MVGALAMSAGLVLAAEQISKPPTAAIVVNTQADTQKGTGSVNNSNWEATLYAIQAANASTSIQVPDQTIVQGLLQGAQSSNITTTIGRTLFVNLSNEAAQGLGSDYPTQDKLIADANSQLADVVVKTPPYKMNDLNIVDDSIASQHAYGNAVITIALSHPEANQNNTLLAVGYATDNNDQSQLDKLPPIEAAYRALAKDLAATPVPQTLAPLHLQLVNNLLALADTYPPMQKLISDPLQGLAALKSNQILFNESGRLFTNIAQDLNKDGILFTKDEPGSAWSAILSP